jgi:outer membrane protein
MLIDKSSDFVVIYSNPVHDYTDYVMDELGLGGNEEKDKNNKTNAGGVNTPAPATKPPVTNTPNNKTTKPKQ